MVAAFLAFVLGSQNLVTHETRAARVPLVLAHLEISCGLSLASDASMQDEVVVIRAVKVKPDELLDKIARAVVGRWQMIDGKRTLVADVARRAEQERQRVALREKRIQASLDKWAKELKPLTAESISEQVADRLTDPARDTKLVNPFNRLGIQAALNLGAKELAKIERGKRVVLSTHPVKGELSWRGSEALLKTFVDELGFFEEHLPTNHEMPFLLRIGNFASEGERVIEDVELVRRGIAYVAFGDVLAEPFIRVGFLSPDRARTITAPFFVSLEPPTPLMAEVPEGVTANLEPEPDTARIILLAPNLWKPGHEVLPLNDDLAKSLRKPLDFEPLQIGAEMYLQYAKARGLNLVANLNDNSWGRFLVATKQTTQTFEKATRTAMTYEVGDGWLILAPNQPSEARRNRDSRRAMQVLLGAGMEDGFLDLDEYAALIVTRQYRASNSLTIPVGALLDPEVHVNRAYDELALRVYAGLTSQQKKAGGAKVGSLGPGARAALAQAAINGGIVKQSGYPEELVRSIPSLEYIGTPFEATTLLPEGLPSEAMLTYSAVTAQGIRAGTFDNSDYETIQQIARRQFYEANPQLVVGDMGSWGKADAYTAVAKTKVVMTVLLNQALRIRLTLELVRPACPPGPLSRLPDSILAEIQKWRDQFNKLRDEGKMNKIGTGVNGRTIPPHH